MTLVTYITHPEVVKDARIPVPDWPLSDLGKARMAAIARLPELSDITSVWSSAEQKSLDGAEILAKAVGCQPTAVPSLGEIDRSAAGYHTDEDFRGTMENFYLFPESSASGWEPACQALDRILNAIDQVIVDGPPGGIAIVGHGTVGSLLFGHLRNSGIDIANRPPSMGSFFLFDRFAKRILSDWQSHPAP